MGILKTKVEVANASGIWFFPLGIVDRLYYKNSSRRSNTRFMYSLSLGCLDWYMPFTWFITSSESPCTDILSMPNSFITFRSKISNSYLDMLFVHSKASLYEQGFEPTLGGLIHMLALGCSLLTAPSKLMLHISFSACFLGSTHSVACCAALSSTVMTAAGSSSSKLRSL